MEGCGRIFQTPPLHSPHHRARRTKAPARRTGLLARRFACLGAVALYKGLMTVSKQASHSATLVLTETMSSQPSTSKRKTPDDGNPFDGMVAKKAKKDVCTILVNLVLGP